MLLMRGLLAIGLLAVLLAACGDGSDGQADSVEPSGADRPTAEDAAGTLTDLNDIEELQVRFNQDRGMARVVLLLSPT